MRPTQAPPNPDNVTEYSTIEDMAYDHIIKVLGHPNEQGEWVYLTSWGTVVLRPVGDKETATTWTVLAENDKAGDFFATFMDGSRE